MLPDLANKILGAADERSNTLLKSAETKVNSMMNEMLPALAEQTMKLVTEQSRNLVEQTTAKANDVMQAMELLLPTYAKNISDSVAQTVRENNAHYHKMLTEIKGILPNLPAADANTIAYTNINLQNETLIASLQSTIEAKLNEMMQALLDAKPVITYQVSAENPVTTDTQSDQSEEESNESTTE